VPSDANAITLPQNLYHVNAVVKDVDKTVEFLSSKWGLGPWKVMDFEFTRENTIVGEPCKIRLAFAKLGSTALELIQPLEGKSVWSEFLETKGEGLHHIAFSVSNWDEMVSKVQEHGGKMIAAGIGDGQRFSYFDIRPGGLVIEFEEQSKEGKPVLTLD